MSKEINFANVNVSIQEFQKLSKGDYNAGEVKLTSETRLTKINNHVYRLRANNKTMSHTEIMVIKDAFIRALSNNGVAQEEIDRVRKELGLAPADSHDSGLMARSLKPLSRQQIRQILDRNAETINAHTGTQTIRTSAQLYGRQSVNKQERIIAKREAAVDSTARRRALTENRDIAVYQRTLVGDSDFLSQADREFALTCAKAQREAILRSSDNNPSAERQCELNFRTRNGAHVAVSSGASEAETLRRLDAQILRLMNMPAPSDEIIAMRNDLLSVGNGMTAERKRVARHENWLNGIGRNPEANLRARAAVVILLQERGINDYETLSMVNKQPPANLHMIISSMLNAYIHQTGDDLRNTPLMLTVMEYARRHDVVDDTTYIPAFTPEVNNEVMADMLTSDDPQRFITNDIATMAKECQAFALPRFGADIVRTNDSVHGFADDAAIRAFCAAETEAGHAVTADSLRETYLNSGLKACADKFIANAFKPLLQVPGSDVNANSVKLTGILKNAHPELQQQLIDAGSPAAAHEVLNGLADEMRSIALRSTTIDNLRNGGLTQMLNECLAEELGLGDMSFSADSVNFSKQANAILAELSESIVNGTHDAKTPDAIRAAFREKAAVAAHDRAALFAKVDAMELPARHADAIKMLIAQADTVQGIDLDAMVAKIQTLHVNGYLAGIMVGEGAYEGTVYAAMHGLNAHMTLDGVENDAVQPIMIQLLAAGTPGMTEAVDAFFARDAVQSDLKTLGTQNAQQNASYALPYLSLHANSANKSAIIDSLGKGSMSPFFAKALIAAADEAGFEALPMNEKISLFSQDKELGLQLRTACKGLPDNVGLQPNQLKTIAVGVLNASDKTGLLARLDAYNTYRGIVEAPALAAGYNKSEISSLCDAFRLYKGATGCSDADALKAVLDNHSAARRLYGFGGRFTVSTENFGKGLHLLEQFRDWYQDTAETLKLHKNSPNIPYPPNVSATILNGDEYYMNSRASFAFEKFIFDEIANNAALPLEHQDSEQIFGMANNPATRYIGRGYVVSSLQTIAQIPPKVREVVYGVLDVVLPIRQNADVPKAKMFNANTPTFIARIIKHLDEIRTMQANGTLTYANFVNLAFSEVPDAANKNMYDVLDWYTENVLLNVVPNEFNNDASVIPTIMGAITKSGCTLAEAIAATKENRMMPSLPYIADVATSLQEMNGNWDSGRAMVLADLVRPMNASIIRTGAEAIPAENAVFTVGFPDGTVLKTRHINVTNEETRASAEAIADKVEEFVGHTHPDQLNAVLFNLSQSGMSAMRDGLTAYGISSTEHAPMTYTLSQDKTTGVINIHYEQPEGFPIKYHWDTEVSLNGTSISTSIVVEGSV